MDMLGCMNRLPIARIVDHGAYLESETLGDILLPIASVPNGAEVDDVVEVFIYRDSEDRLIATTDRPKVEVGLCEVLEVVDVNRVGAFVDWGLPKDLFVPYAEQYGRMKVGERHVIYAYIDNTDRLAGSARLERYLSKTSQNYEVGDEVDLLVSRPTELGWEVVVDNDVIGLVFRNDDLDQLAVGVRIEGYVKTARDDGKLTLCLQPPDETSDDLGQRILAHIRASGGTSTLTDKSSPDEIFDAFGVSKRAFKRALGGLYKQRLVVLGKGEVTLAD